MAWNPSQLTLSPFQDQTQDIVNTVQSPRPTRKPTLSTELLIGSSSSQFHLPDGWIVEERPRRSNPTHVDRYYYEPHTRKQFRSLSSVRRYLAGETEDHVIAKRMKSKKAKTNLIESGVGQQSSSLRAVDNFLLEENTSTEIPKLILKSGSGEKKVRDTINYGKSVYKPSSVAKEEIITPMSWKHSIPSGKSVKLDYPKKTNPESSRASVHNLTTPPPAKVSWVLSGPSGNWNPMVDGSPVPESEKRRWSEAFVQSINRNGVNGPKN